MKKKHGWILQAANGLFVNRDGGETNKIRDAHVFETRCIARDGDDCILPMDDDVVRKVKINRKNEAVKVIPGR